MRIRKLLYRWKFGAKATEAEDCDRRLAALTWIKQTDPETLKRINLINELPEAIRLEVAELYQRSFELQQNLIEQRELVVQAIAKKNIVAHEVDRMKEHIVELEADKESDGRCGPAVDEARCRLASLVATLSELESQVDHEKERIKRLEIETRIAAQVAHTTWSDLLMPDLPSN